MKTGVVMMSEQFPQQELFAVIAQLEALGFESLWLPELFGRDPFATAGYLLGKTERILVATGIANVYARDAHSLAQSRHALAELSGGRFILGLGVSNPGINKSRGHAWLPPLAKMRTTLEAMEAASTGGPTPLRKAPTHVAAHGPKLQRLATTRSDGVITYLMPPMHTRRSRALMGGDGELSVFAPFIAEADAKIARARARSALRMYMSLDYYHREWRQLGFSDADFTDGGSDGLIDTLVAWGEPAQLRQRLQEYETAGATRVVVIPLGLKSRQGIDDRVLLAAAPAAAR